jgi:hypothetical protein
VRFGAIPAETSTPRGTVTSTAAHRGLESPFAVANWLASAVSLEIADLGTVTPPDCCEDEQLARASAAISGNATTRTRERLALLIVGEPSNLAALFHRAGGYGWH